MFRYALADLRQSALIACGVVAGFALVTGIIVPEVADLLKAIGF